MAMRRQYGHKSSTGYTATYQGKNQNLEDEILELWSWVRASKISKTLKRGCCEVVMGMILDALALQPLNAPLAMWLKPSQVWLRAKPQHESGSPPWPLTTYRLQYRERRAVGSSLIRDKGPWDVPHVASIGELPSINVT